VNEFEERLTREDEREAERFAAALAGLDAGRTLPVDPEDAPELYAELRTVARLRDAASQIEPRAPYRTRSRALLIESAAPLAHRHARQRPVVNRPSFLVPFASAAAAAGLTIAAVLTATTLGYGPGGGKVPAEETVAATNLTRRSIEDDLRTLQTTVDAVVAAANRGEDLSPALLRSIAETALNVTRIIETSPQSVRNEDVIALFQLAATTNLKLGEIAPHASVASTSALGTARQASQDAVFAAGKRIQAIEEELASGQRNQ
jgi:ribosomal protein S11